MSIQQTSMEAKLMHILLVEDDEVDIMNVQRAFKKAGVSNPLHIARNGLEALELLRDSNLPVLPKIVLLDINMPKMNGLEFLEEIRKDDSLKHLSVFVLSTSNEGRDKLEAYKHNVAGYIVKPVQFSSFLQAVNTLQAYWQLIELPG